MVINRMARLLCVTLQFKLIQIMYNTFTGWVMFWVREIFIVVVLVNISISKCVTLNAHVVGFQLLSYIISKLGLYELTCVCDS